jgi:hypothetical protein
VRDAGGVGVSLDTVYSSVQSAARSRIADEAARSVAAEART